MGIDKDFASAYAKVWEAVEVVGALRLRLSQAVTGYT